MREGVREDALRLLYALNELLARGRTFVAVMPEPRVVASALLDYDRLDAAVWWLLDEGALQRDEGAESRLVNAVGRPEYGWYFNLTEHGLALLRDARHRVSEKSYEGYRYRVSENGYEG